MKKIFTLLFVITAVSSITAATFRNYVAHTISGNTYSVFVNSDTAFGETSLGEIRYTPSGGGADQFTGIQDGVFDDTTVSGANWKIDIIVPSGATNLILQLATRNQSGSNYGFTGFTITMNNLLPVQLTAFKAILKNSETIITFQTTTELNNSHFEVEQSSDSKTWKTIGKVAGTGTTNEVQNYSYTDKNPVASINYYRLKQVDYDGAFEYSPIVSVDMGKDETINTYPNPVEDELTFAFATEQKKGAILSIYSINGQLVKEMILRENVLKIALDINDITEGIYTVQVVHDKTQLMSRFVKQ